MTELLTATQMRTIEQAAIESGEVTGLELMERAGAGVVEAIFEEWPELAADGPEGGAAPHPADSPRDISGKRKAVVLCGPGNNGGDGFVVARLLKERGWEVEVFLYGDTGRLPPDARVNYERWLELGEVQRLENGSAELLYAKPPWYDLIVDALFGTGLKRGIEGLWTIQTSIADNVADGLVKVVSVDIPSGVCSDSGKGLWPTERKDYPDYQIAANLSVSFHSEKVGHRLADGPEACGRIVVKSIGIEGGECPGAGGVVNLAVAPVALRAGKSTGLHKYTHGHALILSGGPGHTGAARLAARGALRIGAGVVTLGCPPAAQTECAAQLTAIMLRRIGDAPVLAKTLEDKRINALCLGPAMGTGEDQAALLKTALESGRAMVLDADALTMLSIHKALFDLLHGNCVLTPHAGEFSRLFPGIAEKLNATPTKGPAYSKVDATREAAVLAGCVVLFKGPDTVIASPDGCCSVNSAHYDRSAPWLATAGSGDVLAGFVTGLLARGLSPMQAAETGAWLHVECALSYGPGLIAEDLPEQLPAVFRARDVF